MSEIESVKPAISVVIDDGDFIINSTGPLGKAMSQAILPLAAGAKKVTIISDGEMKVMKRSGNGAEANSPQANQAAPIPPTRRPASPAVPDGPDIQDQYAADLEAGRTGEEAMGESPAPTPGPSEAIPTPQKKRRPQIFQDAAAPPAPELAEAEMDRLLAEAAEAERDAVKAQEDRRFQAQQAIQVGEEPVEEEVKPTARKREPRQLATMGRPCGKCGGSGQTGVEDPSGKVFMGTCAVCHGEGQTQVFARGPKFR